MRFRYLGGMTHTPTARLPLGNPPLLTTARLSLRATQIQDAATIAELANDWEIARRLARLPHPYAIGDAHFFLREIVPHELAWAITSKNDGALLGVAGLVPHAAAETVELGYWLGQRHWGHGFATEAAQAITRYAFEELGLPRLISGCFVENVGSRRVLAKIGFEETGYGNRACLAVGSDLPFIEMTLERTV